MNKKYIGGVLGGLAGGVVFGAMMAMMGMMPMIAKLVGSDSVAVGWLIHLVISIVIGFSFAWWFGSKAVHYGAGAGFGLLHGLIWWILGPLFFMPVMLGMGPQFASMFSQMSMTSLVGHLLYGLILGEVYVAVTKR